jgi:hypothetical protein
MRGALILGAVLSCFVQAPLRAGAPTTFAFENVNVISMNPNAGPKLRKRQTVIVEDGEIVAIGKASQLVIPAEAQIIKARRMYLLPGLHDMHAHGDDIDAIVEDFNEEDLYTFYLANGITSIYDPWGFKSLFKWRQQIERGKVIGPQLHFSSPGVNDNSHASADAVEESVRKWARQGYTSIKTHSPISQEKFERLHAVARELNLPVVGHALRPGFPIQTTLDQGQAMIAHIEEILSTEVPFSQPENFIEDLAIPLADVADSRTWVTTTVGTYDIIVKTVGDETFEQLFQRKQMRYLPPSVHNFWRTQNIYKRDGFLQEPDFWSTLLDVKLYIANELKELDALDRLLFGTDSGVPLLVPGFGIHDEFRLLTQAGLTPWQALQTATFNPAVFLETIDEKGTVEVGKRADLLLVRKNPLRKIGNLKKVAGVMADGHWLPMADLDARLNALAARWEE